MVTYPINIWINEERFEKLQKAGLADMAIEVLAGMKVLPVPATERQKDEVLKLFPMAKFDSATTKSIELLPRKVKDKIFDLVILKKSLNVMDEFIGSYLKK
ncbi:MAG TPA: hypothetical protein VJM77_00705 [Nitrospiria bacterium]|nr:hypothetical protein [Nitrospiria bacterium]